MTGSCTVRPRPCATCPYRRDVPSALWDAAEYEKLPQYDGSTGDQAEAGAFALFHCHSAPDALCAGWVGCHDMDENLAIRMTRRDIDPAVFSYVSPVPLFASGAEAARHGMRDIRDPGPEAMAGIAKLKKLVGKRKGA